ncbi:MAG TPA: SDR family NAD(P)-dependent oxidoreductase [Thermoanaerobaculia bacterium]|nr:SDR family NAD(P)-dependent oxidoreductase [Thermoanaerobaculia bacterium]
MPGETSQAGKIAVVTGASSGIGAASARALAAAGFQVVMGARRLERLHSLAREINGTAAGERPAAGPGAAAPGAPGTPETPAAPAAGSRAWALPLDVTDAASVAAFAAQVPRVHLLVNNAGGALGLDPITEAKDEDWRTMWEVNVLGLMRMTRALLPALLASGDGHVINIGSIAGFETYAAGGGYTSVKHAVRAISRTLRLELLGKPVRVTEVDPGLVETEFSQVRFHGDQERASAVYRGLRPLSGEDVADCVVWAATRPSHVNVDEIVVRPRDQATAHHVHRLAQEPGVK